MPVPAELGAPTPAPSILDRSGVFVPSTPRYPTQAHERAAAAIVAFFADRDETDAVLLVNSCARGKAMPDSCLDIKVLVPEGADPAALDEAWRRHHDADPVFAALREVGRFAVLHLDLEDERFDPISPPEDEYPDPSEIAIGNFLVYSVPLWERGDQLARLRRRWLPYYDEALRQERLTAAR